jgi:hypothetical protein
MGAAAWLQVVYPVLDAKVRNVTLAYSVEHQDEVRRQRQQQQQQQQHSAYPIIMAAWVVSSVCICIPGPHRAQHG